MRTGGSNKSVPFGVLWDDDYKNDVWSSTDGITWTQETAAAGFSGRRKHQLVVFDNKLWLIGGMGFPGFGGGPQNDVWSSADGVTWARETGAAPFSPRSGHQALVFDNKLLVIGGIDANFEPLNDVWSSSDGVSWRFGYHNVMGFP